jgi:hypothetical protein
MIKDMLASFDWGARTSDIMAVLWPERCKATVSVGGQAGYRKYLHDFAKLI